jgi:putative ABC transport system permease protein
MKLIDILKTASANMAQSRLRTGLTIVAVFIGALTLSLTNGIGSGISSYVTQQVNALGAKDVLIVTPKTNAASLSTSDAPQPYDPNQVTRAGFAGQTVAVLTQKDIDTIAAQSGITSVQARKNVTLDYVSAGGSGKYQVSVTEYLDGTSLPMRAGVLPDNTSSALQVSLPYDYPSSLGFASAQDAVGKTVTLGLTDATGNQQTVQATVSGIEEETVINDGSGNANNALFDKLYSLQSQGEPAAALNKYGGAVARFDTNLSDTQLTALKQSLADKGYEAETTQDQLGNFNQVLNTVVIVLDLFGAIALLAASFGVINTLLMAVQERTKEIGLMKAMGMGSGRIFLLFSAEAILLGFWGSALGSLAAFGIGHIANAYASKHFLQGLPGLNLLAFPWQSTATIMLIIMAITFLAGTLPARRAARLNPIDALRYE